MELALGYCGWGPRDFWDSTWFELACAVRGTRQFGIVALIAKMFGGGSDEAKGRVGAPWSESEAVYLMNELEASRPALEDPSNVIQWRKAAKRARADARG